MLFVGCGFSERKSRVDTKCKAERNNGLTAEVFFTLQAGAKSSPIRHLRLGDRLTERQGGKDEVGWDSLSAKFLGNPSLPTLDLKNAGDSKNQLCANMCMCVCWVLCCLFGKKRKSQKHGNTKP